MGPKFHSFFVNPVDLDQLSTVFSLWSASETTCTYDALGD